MKDDQFTQILRAINDVRDDMKIFKNEINEKVNKLDDKVNKLNEKVDKNHREMRSRFDAYENSIESMYQENKNRIIILEKRLKVVNA